MIKDVEALYGAEVTRLAAGFVVGTFDDPNFGDLHLNDDIVEFLAENHEITDRETIERVQGAVGGFLHAFKQAAHQVEAPACPNCGAKIDTIHTSQQINLVHDGSGWKRDRVDFYETFQCPECSEEFSPAELDRLGVPNEVR
jgi:hypothetical protein